MKTVFSAAWSPELEAAFRERCKKPYRMSLTSPGEIAAVRAAVNHGIDSHLEACFIRDRGDSYERGERSALGRKLCNTLECVVSPESLVVLVRRRLTVDFEHHDECPRRDDGDAACECPAGDVGEEAASLASCICQTLDIELI